jgi:hypothetical protein
VPEVDAAESHRHPTVFISYSSGDRDAARAIKNALPGFGLEVWYDESELGGGEAWDQKIRRQIRECDFFMALISAQTEARHEGYFRREWRLAVERTLDMADDHPFLLPIVIDDTRQTGARVPEKFFAIQWVRVPGGQPNAAFEAMCRRLVSGESAPQTAQPPALRGRRVKGSIVPANYPDFPADIKAPKYLHWLHVAGWAIHSGWIFFNKLPRVLRVLVYVWLGVVLLSRGCTGDHQARKAEATADSADKIRASLDKRHTNFDNGDVAKIATQIAKIVADNDEATPKDKAPLLAIPFAAPAGDAAAEKLASTAFAQVYGKVSISQHGRVGLSPDAVQCGDLKAAQARGAENHSDYVLCGAIGAASATQALTISILQVADGKVSWTKSYPIAGADPAQIAAEVESKIPALPQN